MDKVIRDGKVAVLISEGYGAGFYTWAHGPNKQALLFHPKLVEFVEQGRFDEITKELCEEIVGGYAYVAGAHDLVIHWLPVGTRFTVTEFDGAEEIVTIDDLPITA